MRRGDIVAGKYRLVRELGAGAQGRVWEAIHLQIGTPLALKVLEPHLAKLPDYVQRFQREATAAAALRSSHVVQIFDFGIFNEVPYIAMELLEGEDLACRLQRIKRLPPGEVAIVVTQVVRALERAHRRGIIHRDLKPDNIFLCSVEEGEPVLVKVLDFGIAKGVTGVSLSRTNTGVVLGTPYYMSPEQAQGSTKLDHRTDLWSLGVITFEAMVGRRPFLANNLGDLLVKICASAPPVPSSVDSSVPDGFDDWFLKACSRNLEDRFKSAKEMAATLTILCGAIPAFLSDSSYVGVPHARVPVDEAARAERKASRGIPPRPSRPSSNQNMLTEADPTQVMTDIPPEIARELRAMDIDIPVDVNISELDSDITDEPAESSRPTFPHDQRPSHEESQQDDENEEDDVQLFDASSLAADMKQIEKRQERDDQRLRVIALARRYAIPAGAGALFLLVILLYIALR